MLFKLAIFLLSVSGDTFSAQSLDGVPYHQLNEPILKKDGDYREYAGLVLENKLKVLLISDKLAVRTAVALQTGTGWRDDPDKFPGLSNLCNKLLTERKFADNLPFHEYITSNAGYITAEVSYTESEVSFQVHPNELVRSLERLSELFTKPSFDETTIQEKATAINIAYSKMGNAGTNYTQAAKAALRTTHKYANYKLGPLDPKALNATLLLDHFNKYYSSNLMTLVVLASTDMDTLKKTVIPTFSKIKNSQLKPANLGSPYNDKNLVKHVNIQAPESKIALYIEFSLGPVTEESLKQLHFIKYLISSSDINSLNKLLKSKGSFSGLSVEINNLNDFTEFSVSISHVSTDYVQKIVYILFMYLETLKAKSVTLEQYQAFIRSLSDDSPSKDAFWGYTPHRLVSALGSTLMRSPFTAVLGVSEEPTEIDFESLVSTVKLLNATNFNVYEIAPFENFMDTEPLSTELLFGRNYTISNFSDEFLARLRTITTNDFSEWEKSDETYEMYLFKYPQLNRTLLIKE